MYNVLSYRMFVPFGDVDGGKGVTNSWTSSMSVVTYINSLFLIPYSLFLAPCSLLLEFGYALADDFEIVGCAVNYG